MLVNYKLLCFVGFLLLITICYYSYRSNKRTYIGSSPIQGEGLFSNSHFKKGDVILDNLFPGKPNHVVLYSTISSREFSNYISLEGSKINHCSRHDNSTVVTNDKKLYKLMATKDINPGDEITSNYDKIHKMYPFIDGSKVYYSTC